MKGYSENNFRAFKFAVRLMLCGNEGLLISYTVIFRVLGRLSCAFLLAPN